MAGKPHENIDCSFFDDIINGHLRPDLPLYNSQDELRKFTALCSDVELTDEEFNIWISQDILPEHVLKKLEITNDDVVNVYKFDDHNFAIYTIEREIYLEFLFVIDLPPPFSEKSEAFLFLINNGYEKIRTIIKQNCDSIKSEKHLVLYANNNIQALKQLVLQAVSLDFLLASENKDYSNDSNAYIIYIVKMYIIKTIFLYQEILQPFTKEPIHNLNDLKTQLYGDGYNSELSKIIEARYKPLRSDEISDVFDYINEGILHLEFFIDGKISEMFIYNILGAVNRLLRLVVLDKNYTQTNISVIDNYFCIFSDILDNDENGEYEVTVDLDNVFFKRILKEISDSCDLIESFAEQYELIPNEEPHKNSIFDVILHKKEFQNNNLVLNPKYLPKNSLPGSKTKAYSSLCAYSYIKYSANLSALTYTLDSLKKNNFIAQDTDLKDFRKIFNNTTPAKPITWTGTISELSCFIKLLHNDFKYIADLKGNIWKVTAKLFVDTNGNPFEGQRFRGQKTPAKADLLEKAVEHLS